MDATAVFVYGIVQGLTEFLPISSSGHLVLLPHILDIRDPGVFFDLSMHVGTALAVLVYFRSDISLLFWDALGIVRRRRIGGSFYSANLVVSTAATFLCILALEGISSLYARNPSVVALNLAVFGLLMALVDAMAGKSGIGRMRERLHIVGSLWIGFAQSIAIFPGVSRSGVTVTAARVLGLGREEAVRYSFLLSLPVILGGFFYKVLSLEEGSAIPMGQLAAAAVLSFVVGFVAIHCFLGMVRRVGLWVFCLYRIVLAAAVFLFLV